MKRKAEKEMGAPEEDKLWGIWKVALSPFCFWEELDKCQPAAEGLQIRTEMTKGGMAM